jgi:hypothetical protein
MSSEKLPFAQPFRASLHGHRCPIQLSPALTYPLHKFTGKTGYFRNAGFTAANPHK